MEVEVNLITSVFYPFLCNIISVMIKPEYNTSVKFPKFKSNISDIENGTEIIGDTPNPAFVLRVRPVARITTPIKINYIPFHFFSNIL